MTFQEIVAEIEDGSMPAYLGLASSSYTLLRRLEDDPVVMSAREWAAADRDFAAAFLGRAEQILATPAPAGFEHPDDLSLSVYLFVLARIPLPQIQTLIARVAKEQRQEFFVSTSVARYFDSRLSLAISESERQQLPVFSRMLTSPGRDLREPDLPQDVHEPLAVSSSHSIRGGSILRV